MKVAIYIRTSTDEQNPKLQIKDCEKLAGKDYLIYSDQQSAFKENIERENFNKLKKDIKKGLIDFLYVWDLDRIYRNRKSLISFFQFCKIFHCKIFSYRQQWLNELNNIQQPFNEIMFDLMLNIMGWLAEEESQKKSDRIKNAVRKKQNKTVSYKGNKWGRKSLSKQIKNKIIELHKSGISMRQIQKQVWIYDEYGNKKKNVSLGAVHKTLQ